MLALCAYCPRVECPLVLCEGLPGTLTVPCGGLARAGGPDCPLWWPCQGSGP